MILDQRAFAACMILLIVLSGCMGMGESHSVRFDGTVAVSGGEFVMDGRVFVSGGTAPAQHYSDVSVGLYDADREVLDRVVLGNMSAFGDAPGERRVNISREFRPAYVVIESPGFWRDGCRVSVVAFGWDGSRGLYDSYWVTDASEKFEVD